MKRAKCFLLVLVLALAGVAQAQSGYVLLDEDFEGLALGPNVDEGVAGDAVWTDIPPAGWINDASGVPGVDDPGNDGVTEWAGWGFADKDWWIETAGDQDRSTFDLGEGTLAIADPDEWDDAGHADSASAGWYKVFLSTAPIDLSTTKAGTVQLKFDSSWRPEFDGDYHQSAKVTVSFDGGEPVELMLWLSDSSSPNFKDYATNETITLDIDNPAGATSMVLTFGLFDAGNDWWWAIDNLLITADRSAIQAYRPSPQNGAVEVSVKTDLSWTPGEYVGGLSPKHKIILSDDLAAVEDGTAVIATQDANSLDATGLLGFSTTYYWRVDEANSTSGWDEGFIWSFTTEAFAYPIEGVIATSNATFEADAGPENTVNGSGLNADDQHSTLASDMFLGVPGDDPVYVMYEFDKVHKLHEMLVWNYNEQFELVLGFGLKSVTVEYSENGEDWTVLGDVELNQATATATYAANTAVAFDGVPAKFVKLTVNSSWGFLPQPQYGLSEVRFLSIPAQAREPQPGDGAAGVSVATMLSWRAGREAVSHEVNFGTDSEALPLVDTTGATSYAPGALDMGATYYWKIDEVNEAEAISTWAGAVWSFSTQAFLVVDDFESYTDDLEAGAIFLSWIDGYEMPANGSMVGHIEAPFAETTIVKSGSQSMPMFYDNSGTSISEAELALAQNWTTSGVKSLAIAFAGAAGNTGQLYVKINGTKVLYDGDSADLARGAWQAWNIDLSTVGGNLSNVTSLAIGVEGAGASGVLYVDDIRLYSQVAEAIEPIAPDDGDADLLGLWKLDDGSGTTAADSSGNNHTGALMNGPQWVTNGANGGALQMDGADDYVVLGTISYGDASNPGFTAALWVKTDGWNDDAAMLSNKDWNSGSNIGWAIAGGGGDNGSWQWNFSDGDTRVDFDPAVSLSAISDGGWHHLCVTHDRAGMAKFYHNGLLIDERDISAVSGTLDSGLPTVLGTDGAEGAVWEYWFTGAFDDVRLYNRALSNAEVAGLAGRTAPLYESF